MPARGPRIALVTCERFPQLADDDRIAQAALEERGALAAPCVWSDARVDWTAFDAIVLRSTWDYHLRLDEFRAFLDRLEHTQVPVWNPPPVLRWNLDKRYLDTLARRGVPTLPTRRMPRGSARTLSSVLDEEGWDEVVVKPPVSASAFRTFRVRRDGAAAFEEGFRAAVSAGDVLVQRFSPEVVTEGEWSACFFAGELSHVVLKRPRAGDFRTQAEHGATQGQADAPAAVLAGSREALARVDGSLLYARVDGIVAGGVFRLMELELIEPSFFFASDAAAAGRFAEATLRFVRR